MLSQSRNLRLSTLFFLNEGGTIHDRVYSTSYVNNNDWIMSEDLTDTKQASFIFGSGE